MTPQETLWAFSNHFGQSWWLMCSAFALPAAFIILLKMVINEPFSTLLVGRVFLMGGFLAFGIVPLNSGWLPIGVLLASIGGFISAILIATGWCVRSGEILSLIAGTVRRATDRLHARSVLRTKDGSR